ncbi:hypothetical protein NDU88_004955, partial [Pleurodeles waltl]
PLCQGSIFKAPLPAALPRQSPQRSSHSCSTQAVSSSPLPACSPRQPSVRPRWAPPPRHLKTLSHFP